MIRWVLRLTGLMQCAIRSDERVLSDCEDLEAIQRLLEHLPTLSDPCSPPPPSMDQAFALLTQGPLHAMHIDGCSSSQRLMDGGILPRVEALALDLLVLADAPLWQLVVLSVPDVEGDLGQETEKRAWGKGFEANSEPNTPPPLPFTATPSPPSHPPTHPPTHPTPHTHTLIHHPHNPCPSSILFPHLLQVRLPLHQLRLLDLLEPARHPAVALGLALALLGALHLLQADLVHAGLVGLPGVQRGAVRAAPAGVNETRPRQA